MVSIKMSTVETEKKRRGRPPKAQEDKIQDFAAYQREWYHSHKEDENLKDRRREISRDKAKRLRQLYTLIKNLVEQDVFSQLPEEHKKAIYTLTKVVE